MKIRKVTILGSTGSIGINALRVIENLKEEIRVIGLSCNKNIDLLINQIKTFNPLYVSIADEEAYHTFKNKITNHDIELFKGRNGLLEISSISDNDLIINGLVGSSGMEPTLCAIKKGINVALANKESLVMAGSLIEEAMNKSGAKIFPVDSEHSAIWQCLSGEVLSDVKRLILTGSGGPFRTRALDTFANISVSEALAHPNWEMGRKISIDSATMMNKGFELIEAFWLFKLDAKKIDIIIHPQSIIHSMVEFIDSSIKAQIGVPDMKVPIQYALTYPRHVWAPWESLNFSKINKLTFEDPDYNRFPCLLLAKKSLKRLGSSPTALNLSNDYAVERFLKGEIPFHKIHKINKESMDRHNWLKEPKLNDIKELDIWIKNYVYSF